MWKCEREGIREDGEIGGKGRRKKRRSSHSPQALAVSLSMLPDDQAPFSETVETVCRDYFVHDPQAEAWGE